MAQIRERPFGGDIAWPSSVHTPRPREDAKVSPHFSPHGSAGFRRQAGVVRNAVGDVVWRTLQ